MKSVMDPLEAYITGRSDMKHTLAAYIKRYAEQTFKSQYETAMLETLVTRFERDLT